MQARKAAQKDLSCGYNSFIAGNCRYGNAGIYDYNGKRELQMGIHSLFHYFGGVLLLVYGTQRKRGRVG